MENFTNNKMNEQVFQERNLRNYFEIIYEHSTKLL